MEIDKDSRLQTISEHAAWFGELKGVDAVVFVHGLKGHFRHTWGRFPELLAGDPDLPALDILLWGYKSSALRPFVQDTATLGRQIASTLTLQIAEKNRIHLVGHSMGGLIILESVTQEMLAMRAEQHPCASIDFITLFAAPVTGSMASAMLDNTVGKLPVLRWLVNRQLRSLAKGTGVEGLRVAVRDRVFNPKGEDASRRRIPIRMVMASKDAAVSEADRNTAFATFNAPNPLELAYDHRNVKLPVSRRDDRYQALANDLKTSLATSFQRLCQASLSPDRRVRREAEYEIERRYGRVFRERFYTSFADTAPRMRLYLFYRAMINRVGAIEGRPPHSTAQRVLMRMRRYGLVVQ